MEAESNTLSNTNNINIPIEDVRPIDHSTRNCVFRNVNMESDTNDYDDENVKQPNCKHTSLSNCIVCMSALKQLLKKYKRIMVYMLHI